MYTSVKEKMIPSSPTRFSSPMLHRVMPRHMKAYLWLTFLALTFGIMLLLDNGVSISDLLPRFRSSYAARKDATITAQHIEQVISLPNDQRESHSSPTNSQAQHGVDSESLVFGTGARAFTPDDVVILFKTGATTLWRRVPIHLSTSFANKTLTPNVVFYSDQADHIAGQPIIDALANISSTVKSTPDFELYRNLQTIRAQNLYLESASIDGDHYLPGGWRLDKYKFLPMMAHAALAHPGKKWYIYMEDDNYFFWHSLYTWLSTFDPATPFFLGGPAARLGEDFANGGSGFMLSGAALTATFGTYPTLAHDFESYAQHRCCGDQVLSHALALSGVPRFRGYDHTGWAGLQEHPPWKMAFGEWNWCSPLFNVHKTHQSDISRLHVLDQTFRATHGDTTTIMTWGHFFNLTLPTHSHLTTFPARKPEWDNLASEKWHRSTESDQTLTSAEREQKPWFSAEACEKACEDWWGCLSWKYADDACALSSTVAAGRPVKEGVEMVSGYMLEKIERLRRKRCGGDPLMVGVREK